MNKKVFGYIYLFCAMSMVGTTIITSKIIAGHMPIFHAIGFRFLIALLAFVALKLILKTTMPKISKRDWVVLAFQAIAGSVGYTYFLIQGLKEISAADAGIILGTLPVVTALFAVFVLNERPNKRFWIGIFFSSISLISVIWSGVIPKSLTGFICIFIAVVCQSILVLMNKLLSKPLNPLHQATVLSAIALLGCIPGAILEPDISFFTIDFDVMAAILWFALGPTFVGFILWYSGCGKVSGSEAAPFTAIAPISAVAFSTLFLNETISVQQIIGGGLVFISMAFMLTPPKKRI